MMMYKDAGIVLIVLLTLASCNKTNENVEVLARVENAYLTKKEVINRFPEYRKTDVEIRPRHDCLVLSLS